MTNFYILQMLPVKKEMQLLKHLFWGLRKSILTTQKSDMYNPLSLWEIPEATSQILVKMDHKITDIAQW